MNVYDKISEFLDESGFNLEILKDEPMSMHTTYKVGGPVKLFVKVFDCEALKALLSTCKKENVPWFILGKGSNLLVSDNGFEGVVVYLDKDFKKLSLYNNVYETGSAVLLSQIVNDSKKNMLSGFEFGVGTPGTIGGAIKMNAGTKDQWISNVIKTITVLDENLNIVEKKADDIQWGYRYSSISDKEIVLKAQFEVKPVSDKDQEQFLLSFKEKMEKRHMAQPLGFPSCGSVFKNPQNNSAGKLIDEAGLKGLRHGGAVISDKHANFILNDKNASAQDILWLIKKAQSQVFNKFAIELALEVKLLGFDNEESIN